MVSQSCHGLDKAGASVFVFNWMFDKQADIMRGTVFRKLTCPFCITMRRMAPMDVGGILDLFERNRFDFQVATLATFSLFKCGMYGSRKQPRGTISLCFHMRFLSSCVRCFFFFLHSWM